ncbi:MAG: hypothetical protein SF052_15120 [Bacteroidia bacterium]|nr:hypothetical protein [Bacteroidia bacterium]
MNILPIIRSLMVIIVLTAITGSVCAQKDLRPGYIITLENDTVKGEIDYRGDILMGDVCRFIYAGQKEIIEFKPGEDAPDFDTRISSANFPFTAPT